MEENKVILNIEIVPDDFDFDHLENKSEDLVYINQSNWQFLEKFAKDQNISISEAFEQVLRAYLKKYSEEI